MQSSGASHLTATAIISKLRWPVSAEGTDANARWRRFRARSAAAGEWVKIALTVSHGLPLPASARLMALLTMTLADTTVPTVGTKFTYGHWRPATAIR